MSGPVSESKKIAKKLDRLEDKWQQGTSLSENGTDGYPVQPAKYFEKDPRDDRMKMKTVVTNAIKTQGATKLGNNVPVTDRDIDYLLDQRTKEEKIQFDRWKYKAFAPGTDPVKLNYYQKIDPNFFKEREEEIDNILGLVGELAKLVLNGVESEEDVALLYAMSTGKVKEPQWKILFPTEWFYDKNQFGVYTKDNLKQGYWNPKKYASERTGKTKTPGDMWTDAYLKPEYDTPYRTDNNDNMIPDFWTKSA